MNKLILYSILSGGLFFIYRLFKKSSMNRRRNFIDTYRFPQTVKSKVSEHYPHLTPSEVNEVIKGLKEYFHICNMAGNRFVSMPSQVVDIAWHEFIIFTKQYQHFCSNALGRFLHHVPAEAMRTPTIAKVGIQRTWRLSCKREKINADTPAKLPILFDIDSKLKIPNGFFYALHCKGTDSSGYCAGDIGGGCGSFGCGGISEHSGDSDCGGGCGGGD